MYKRQGLLGILAAFCLLAFYNVLGGLVMRYMFGFILQILGVDGFAGQSGSFFGYILHDYSGMVFFHVLFIVCNVVIVMGGIQGGIEKFCTVAMPALFFMLLFVIIYVAFQPGAGQGYKDMLTPNFEPISSFSGFLEVLSKAAGQMFFSLSLGMGAIISVSYTHLDVYKRQPILQELGVNLIAAHFFVFYFGIVADITPPVALAAYAGSAIAKSNPMKTGVQACLLYTSRCV